MSKAVKPEAPQKVDYNDAVAESKKYFDGDDLAATVWVSKYALKDSFGNIYETSPRQMHERIAAEIERIERKYPNPMSREEVFGLLDHFRYVIPQGGPMTGIGNNFQVASLSNCFVIGHKHPTTRTTWRSRPRPQACCWPPSCPTRWLSAVPPAPQWM